MKIKWKEEERKAKKEEEMRERLMRMVGAIWNDHNKSFNIIKGYLY